MALESSEEICEALARHVEASGSEAFEKNIMAPEGLGEPRMVVSVWCVVGPNAQAFADACRRWLEENGFDED